MPYSARYCAIYAIWKITLDDVEIGHEVIDEEMAIKLVSLLNDAVAYGEGKSKDAIKETAELLFKKP